MYGSTPKAAAVSGISCIIPTAPAEETAIALCLYCMKAQLFNDGNKRAAVIFANHYLISHGAGMLNIPEKDVPEFKRLLVAYYEGKDEGEIFAFMKTNCFSSNV